MNAHCTFSAYFAWLLKQLFPPRSSNQAFENNKDLELLLWWGAKMNLWALKHKLHFDAEDVRRILVKVVVNAF